MDLICDQYNVEKLLDELLKRHLLTLEKVCHAVGDIADIIRFGDDLGMTSGPFMAPEIYRQIFKSRHKILCDYVKSHSRCIPLSIPVVLYHCLYPILLKPELKYSILYRPMHIEWNLNS